MASRHRSRELASQFVFGWGVDPNSVSELKVAMKTFWREQAISKEDNWGYFETLVLGVAEFLPSIDKKIESLLVNWRFERIDRVDLAVLRVAVFELAFSEEEIDAPIVIDEAVEVSKKFGTENSSSFVNGLLDALRKEKEEAS